MTDAEIEDIEKGLVEDRLYDLKLESTQLPPSEGGDGQDQADLSTDLGSSFDGGGGGGLDSLFGGGETGSSPEPESPASTDSPPPADMGGADSLTSPENASVQRKGNFLKEKDRIRFRVDDDMTPIRAQNNVNRILKSLNIKSKPSVLNEIDYKNAGKEEKENHLKNKKKKYRQKNSGKMASTGGYKTDSLQSIKKDRSAVQGQAFGSKSDLSESEATEELDSYLDERFDVWNNDIDEKNNFSNKIDKILKSATTDIINK